MNIDVRSNPARRRLLVITYHFPPDGSIGGWRWHGLSKYLARTGWDIHVVTASTGSLSTHDGVRVYHVPRAHTLNDAYNALARRWRSAASRVETPRAAAGASASGAVDGASSISWLRANLAATMAFPDYARGWILRAARTARSLLSRANFDAVVTSGPPHSAHVAGLLACAGRHVAHFIDLRDPWAAMADRIWARDASNDGGVGRLTPWLETMVFQRSSGVVANTSEFADLLRARYPAVTVSWVPNGIDSERLPPPAPEKLDGLAIAYVGSLYAGRDLSPVIRALHNLVQHHPAVRKNVKFRVAGNMDDAHKRRFVNEVASCKVADIVEVLGNLPSTGALDLINRSHLALVLAQDQPLQVPAKLYEGMALGVPTLVIAESDSAAAREARRIGALTVEPHDVAGICQVLEDLWTDRVAAYVTATASISYEQIAGLMDQVLRGEGHVSNSELTPQPATIAGP